MKILYVVDENGEFYSEDRKVRYKELRGKALYDYQSSAEGKGEYMDDTDESGNSYGMKIPDELKTEFRSEKRHADYLTEHSKGYITISLDMNVGEEAEETLEAFICAEDSDDVYNTVLRRERINKLNNILPSLDKEEMELIFRLFLSDNLLTEGEYAELIGSSQQAIHYRKKEVLDRLKKFLK